MSTEIENRVCNDLAKLQKLLVGVEIREDVKLDDLLKLLDENPGCFVTVSASNIKIRSAINVRIAKVTSRFGALPTDIVLRAATSMRSIDRAYIFLLTLKNAHRFELVKFNYRGAFPRAKEISHIRAAKENLNRLTINTPLNIQIMSSSTYAINDILDIPGYPKADFAFAYNKFPLIYISHKDEGRFAGKSDSFRQYAGISKFCLGIYAQHPEIIALKDQLRRGFANAGFSMADMRKGSYFAKKIESRDITMAALFGRNFANDAASVDNVDAIIQGPVSFDDLGNGKFALRASHIIAHPRHCNGHLELHDNFTPYFMVTKSRDAHQCFQNTRISIWPHNTAVKRGLENFKSFFIDKEYASFRSN